MSAVEGIIGDILAGEALGAASRVVARAPGTNTLAVRGTGGDVLAYVTVSADPPPPSSTEIAELLEMDALLKAAMTSRGDEGLDPKTLREIIGERRQLQKQIAQLRSSIAAADPEGAAAGKLEAAMGDASGAAGVSEW